MEDKKLTAQQEQQAQQVSLINEVNLMVTAINNESTTMSGAIAVAVVASERNENLRSKLQQLIGNKRAPSNTALREAVSKNYRYKDSDGRPLVKVEQKRGRYMYVYPTTAQHWAEVIALAWYKVASSSVTKICRADVLFDKEHNEVTAEQLQQEAAKKEEAKERAKETKEAKAKEAEAVADKAQLWEALVAGEYHKVITYLPKNSEARKALEAVVAKAKALKKEAEAKAKAQQDGRREALQQAEERRRKHQQAEEATAEAVAQ